MEYELPSKINYTVYSKSGCSFCTKAKNLLVNESIDVIDCDDYLLDNKMAFLDFMKRLIGREYRTFPMIFDKEGKFVGGFTELKASYVPPPHCYVNNDFPDPFETPESK